MATYTITLDGQVRGGIIGLAGRTDRDGVRWGSVLVGDRRVLVAPELCGPDPEEAFEIAAAQVSTLADGTPYLRADPGEGRALVSLPGSVIHAAGPVDTPVTSTDEAGRSQVHACLVVAAPGGMVRARLTRAEPVTIDVMIGEGFVTCHRSPVEPTSGI